jgi:hypothetical protein
MSEDVMPVSNVIDFRRRPGSATETGSMRHPMHGRSNAQILEELLKSIRCLEREVRCLTERVVMQSDGLKGVSALKHLHEAASKLSASGDLTETALKGRSTITDH